MITGFEEETKDLTEFEKTLVPNFIARLKTKVGVENSITSSEIQKAYKAIGKKVEGPRIRKIINWIRSRGLVPGLVASSKGYYIATSRKQMEDYIKSLDERIKSISQIKTMAQKHLNNL